MPAYPTPHINAKPGDFAPVVLMPGDPNRSRFIAEHYLENARMVNNVRGVQGYTGTYKNYPVSVMASGMGMPSIGIYSHELFNVFGVETILRVGSAGGISEGVHIRDIVLGMGACTDSNYASGFRLPGTFAPVASFDVLKTCVEVGERMGLGPKIHVGNVLSTDVFYTDEDEVPSGMRSSDEWKKMQVLAVEMESAALYMNAARSGKKALGIFTVSDHLFTHESTTAEERESTFTEMMELALETAVSISK
ncbi:MAG: purine-nucleoside phosphorylase [Clostridia bacterium]|nr:purine-nucleoside phosphorylase [Clostridia bacterium]